jgi:hypothetical protein
LPNGGLDRPDAGFRDRHQVRQERIRRLRQSAAALHDRDLADEIGVKDDRILVSFDRREQLVFRQLLQSHARTDAVA